MDLKELMTNLTADQSKKSYIHDPMLIDITCMKLFLSASKAMRRVGSGIEYSIPLSAVTGNALFEAIVAKKKASKNVVCMPLTMEQAAEQHLSIDEMKVFMQGVQIAKLSDDAPVLTKYDPTTNTLVQTNELLGYHYLLVYYEKPV